MKRAKQIDSIWDKVKAGSSIPFVLHMRLTDESLFLGNLVVADLLEPEFCEPAIAKPGCSIFDSFTLLSKCYRSSVTGLTMSPLIWLHTREPDKHLSTKSAI